MIRRRFSLCIQRLHRMVMGYMAEYLLALVELE